MIQVFFDSLSVLVSLPLLLFMATNAIKEIGLAYCIINFIFTTSFVGSFCLVKPLCRHTVIVVLQVIQLLIVVQLLKYHGLESRFPVVIINISLMIVSICIRKHIDGIQLHRLKDYSRFTSQVIGHHHQQQQAVSPLTVPRDYLDSIRNVRDEIHSRSKLSLLH